MQVGLTSASDIPTCEWECESVLACNRLLTCPECSPAFSPVYAGMRSSLDKEGRSYKQWMDE